MSINSYRIAKCQHTDVLRCENHQFLFLPSLCRQKKNDKFSLHVSMPLSTHLTHKLQCQMRKLTCPVAQDGHFELVQGLNLRQSQNDVPCPNPTHVTNHSLFQLVEWPLPDLSEIHDHHTNHSRNVMARLRHCIVLSCCDWIMQILATHSSTLF